MWKIKKPDLAVALNDISEFEKKNIVKGDDVDNLKALVRNYDLQRGTVSDAQLNTISADGARKIKNHYSDTDSGGRLNYIRQELTANVGKCPCCSIGETSTLDHYMSQSVYPALSLCRLNLIPMCWECNHKKLAQPYRDFLHAYYVEFPDNVVFLIAHISVSMDHLVISFSFDQNVITNRVLYDQLVKHWTKLKLNERLHKAVIEFIHNDILYDYKDVNQCIETIKMFIDKYIVSNGLNDWRTAVLRNLLDVIQGPNSANFFIALKNEMNNRIDVLV